MLTGRGLFCLLRLYYTVYSVWQDDVDHFVGVVQVQTLPRRTPYTQMSVGGWLNPLSPRGLGGVPPGVSLGRG